MPNTHDEAVAGRDAGMAQVDEFTSDEWKAYADTFIIEYLVAHAELFVDDLWAAGLIPPKSPRALGPRIMKAVRQNLMETTGRYRKSVSSHLSAKPVWHSLIYSGVDDAAR